MIHCSGGAQTKILHFIDDTKHIIKDNLFPVPPLFKMIQEESGTDWKEMYKVFNMGHDDFVVADEIGHEGLPERNPLVINLKLCLTLMRHIGGSQFHRQCFLINFFEEATAKFIINLHHATSD